MRMNECIWNTDINIIKKEFNYAMQLLARAFKIRTFETACVFFYLSIINFDKFILNNEFDKFIKGEFYSMKDTFL